MSLGHSVSVSFAFFYVVFKLACLLWCGLEHDRAMTSTTCQIIWLRWLLADMSVYLKDFVPLHFDNKSVIHITCNSVFHERTSILKQIVLLLVIIFNLTIYLYHLFIKSYFILRFHFLFYKLSMDFVIALWAWRSVSIDSCFGPIDLWLLRLALCVFVCFLQYYTILFFIYLFVFYNTVMIK